MKDVNTWDLYMIPNRGGKGPWLWGVCESTGASINAIPKSGRSGPKKLTDVCVVHDANTLNTAPNLDEKIKKGYMPIGEFSGDSDLILAVGTWFQYVAESLFKGTSVDIEMQSSLWISICEEQKVESSPYSQLFTDQGSPIAEAPYFEHVIKHFSGVLREKAFKAVIAMSDFVFEKGVVSPIW